ncbi:MAG: hypothetical protein WCK02_16460 [Bacteroidota bacterium]
MKKEMVLEEVQKSVLEELGKEKVQENFNNGIFKIKMPNGNLIDSNSIYKHSIENNIKEPILFINPNFSYVQWVVKKDFVRPQIKNHIKSQLTSNRDINLDELQKDLLIEEMKDKKIEGCFNKLPIKTSNQISEGKFHIQSSCSRESAIGMLNEVIKELKVDAKKYIKGKIKRDIKYIIIYILFVSFITGLWFENKQIKTIPLWISDIISILLFLVPFILRIINLSFFNSLFFKKKAEKKYEKDFFDKLN